MHFVSELDGTYQHHASVASCHFAFDMGLLGVSWSRSRLGG